MTNKIKNKKVMKKKRTPPSTTQNTTLGPNIEFLKAMSERNWGGANKPSTLQNGFAGTFNQEQITRADLELLREMFQGRQRLP